MLLYNLRCKGQREHALVKERGKTMTNDELLNSYLLSIIGVSVDIMQNIEILDLNEENIKEIGKMVSKLAEFKNKYIEIPF